MNILYAAGAIALPGRSGGATHVREVAEGLARRGHRLHIVARRGKGQTPEFTPGIGATLLPLPDKLALLGYPALAGAARGFRPDVVMERYYNFAGSGLLYAHRHGLPALLEVNAPMVDPPGSRKERLDRLLGRPMRRWAVRQGIWSRWIVTPLAATVPPPVPRSSIEEVNWGANVDRFRPELRQERAGEIAALRRELGLPDDAVTATFVGSFRAWHGATGFVRAGLSLLAQHPRLYCIAVGGGPELAAARALAAGERRMIFTGPHPHEQVPLLLALSDIGVAPFVPSAYAPLRTFGFYWSPLKVFEYMAMGLPVVAPAIPPLDEIVRDGQEGALYPAEDEAALAAAVSGLVTDASARRAMGARARARVVAHYSWDAHCEQLERALEAIR
ncbi:MAG: glycosyltransferase family 4 protein [Chloroflexia bacterium]